MANSVLDKIPAMSDADLANLFANAQRLSESGSTKQQSAAKELLPALTAETATRRDAKAAAAAKRPSRSKKPKAAIAAAEPVEADEEDGG